jgi:hypothetical protein
MVSVAMNQVMAEEVGDYESTYRANSIRSMTQASIYDTNVKHSLAQIDSSMWYNQSIV